MDHQGHAEHGCLFAAASIEVIIVIQRHRADYQTGIAQCSRPAGIKPRAGFPQQVLDAAKTGGALHGIRRRRRIGGTAVSAATIQGCCCRERGKRKERPDCRTQQKNRAKCVHLRAEPSIQGLQTSPKNIPGRAQVLLKRQTEQIDDTIASQKRNSHSGASHLPRRSVRAAVRGMYQHVGQAGFPGHRAGKFLRGYRSVFRHSDEPLDNVGRKVSLGRGHGGSRRRRRMRGCR